MNSDTQKRVTQRVNVSLYPQMKLPPTLQALQLLIQPALTEINVMHIKWTEEHYSDFCNNALCALYTEDPFVFSHNINQQILTEILD